MQSHSLQRKAGLNQSVMPEIKQAAPHEAVGIQNHVGKTDLIGIYALWRRHPFAVGGRVLCRRHHIRIVAKRPVQVIASGRNSDIAVDIDRNDARTAGKSVLDDRIEDIIGNRPGPTGQICIVKPDHGDFRGAFQAAGPPSDRLVVGGQFGRLQTAGEPHDQHKQGNHRTDCDQNQRRDTVIAGARSGRTAGRIFTDRDERTEMHRLIQTAGGLERYSTGKP